ncbi:MAG TPA: TIGR00159 family protein [Bacteroidetes bacterium]|nr:TIGR00159 family protein [Bacteroidota bacterium]
MIFLFKIGFLPVSFWDILDILIVGYLIYVIYKTLKGSIAFNIFIGVATLLLVYWLLRLLQMEMVSSILNQVASLGAIGIIVIFQPEIRRFLLHLGNTTLRSRSNFVGRWLAKNLDLADTNTAGFQQIKSALLQMGKEKTGALIVLAHGMDLESISDTGVPLDANINHLLLLSIFNKHSPLHDGAVVVGQGKILAAGCVLPVSESKTLPSTAGLRHRAGLGLTEKTNATVFIVSEETGAISFASDGKVEFAISEARLNELLFEQFESR